MDVRGEIRQIWGVFVDAMVVRAMSQLGQAVAYKLVTAGARASLHDLDERAHTAYTGLIKSYQHILEEVTEGAGNVASGVLDVISSRVRLAHESGILEHSVVLEKNEIVTRVISQMKAELKKLPTEDFQRMAEELRGEVLLSQELAQASFDKLVSNIESLSRPLYGVYVVKARECTVAINDLERRKVAAACFKALEQERDILKSIIRIQIHEIEREEASLGVIERLRSVYQVFAKEADYVLSHLSSAADEATEAESYESYSSDIAAKLPNCFPKKAYAQMRVKIDGILKRVREEAGERIGAVVKHRVSATLGQTLYDLRKRLAEVLLMTDSMVNIFKGLHIFYREGKEGLEGGECAEISKGIDETILIKMEAILQSRQDFYRTCEEYLTAWGSEAVQATNVCDVLEEVSNISAGGEDIEHIIDTILEQNWRGEDLSEKAQSWRVNFEKIMNNYLREVLLFEMGSFEEVMNFSAKRLSEQEEGSAPHSYAAKLEVSWRELVEDLSRNGITRILPRPHEAFDAKQHNVLLAEQAEGFSKGQVIRAVSSGYIGWGGIVLSRATIIAAR